MRFVSQQGFFNGQSAAVAHQFPIAADDAVAGHDDGKGIPAIGGSNGARGPGVSNGFGNLSVRCRVSVRYGPKGLPDFELKRGSLRSESDLERFPFSRKVFFQLPNGLPKRQFGIDPPAVGLDRMSAILKRDLRQRLRGACQ